MNMLTTVAADGAVDADRQRRRWPWITAAAVALIGVAVYEIEFRSAPAVAATTLPSVTVSAPLQREVTEWDDYVGRFAPSQTVEVRPRVSGAVTAIHFKDGEIVRKGQLLFTIDPRPFAAALAEARAGAASARSQLVLANADLARANRLTGDEAISVGEMDTLRAKAQAAQAALAGAEARVRSRALDLEFTAVRAPIGGRISDRRADIGNLVAGEGAGTATLLTTINALDPIYFSFDGSEALYLKAQRSRAAGIPAEVQIKLQDENEYRWKGRIDFSDNGIDTRSGTMRSRAVISNPDYFLTPGMFGNMRLASAGKRQALLVPDTAVQTDQARKTLLVVAQDGTVSAKPVELGPVVEGLRIIRAGLAPGDQVVIQGTQSAMAGAKVAPHAGKIVPDTVTPAASVAPQSAQATLGS
jgi:RND family efflux transporter MFP subunit